MNLGRRRYHGLFVEASKRLSQGWQVNGSYAYNNGRSNIGPTRFLIGGGTEAFNPDLDWARDEPSTHTAKMNAIWDLPFLRDRGGLISTLFGNWQLATIWNVASGSYFTPVRVQRPTGGAETSTPTGGARTAPISPRTCQQRTAKTNGSLAR